MQTLAYIFIFLLGAIIGSFLNVVIYRFNTGKSIVKGRSICMTCSRHLRWYELIPILSYLLQSGKCRRCKDSISSQYLLVEFITGLIFVATAYHFLPIFLTSYISYLFFVVLFVFIFSLLIVISVYDLRHKIIPDKLVYIYIIVSFLSIFITYTGSGLALSFPPPLLLLSGPIFALPFAFLWLISKGKWMGLGDAKLILGIGWMLGMASLSALIIAFWVGAIVSLFVMFFSRNLSRLGKAGKIGMKTEIPFAPFLIIGTLITFFFNLDVFSLAKLLSF